MITDFEKFVNLCKNNLIEMTNKKFKSDVCKFKYYLIIPKCNKIDKINQIRIKSKTMTIDQYSDGDNDYLIFCFNETIIIISKSNLDLINIFLQKNNFITIIPLSTKSKELFLDYLSQNPIFNNFSEKTETEIEEVNILAKSMQILNHDLINFWKTIRQSIASSLLTKCYEKTRLNRIELYDNSEKDKIEMNKTDYIKLSEIGLGSSTVIYLIYHIEKVELFALKIFMGNVINKEINELFEREKKFYKNLKHPFLSNCYGKMIIDSKYSLILEYIHGHSLDSINKLNLNFHEKIKIIFQILIVIEFLHQNKFIYRDIKPNNFIIDSNKSIVLIDRDRMAEKLNQNICGDITKTLFHIYLAPEIQSASEFSYSSDIYSLGLLIYFIIVEKQPEIKYDNNFNPILISFDKFPDEYKELKNICKNCIEANPLKRPRLTELIDIVYIHYFSRFLINETNTIQKVTNIHSIKFTSFWYFLSENHLPYCQYKLGNMYENGLYFKMNMKKSIQYYQLASDGNYSISQFHLGDIYREGRYVRQDLDKAIYYYSLAAKNNYPYAYFYLGNIYYDARFHKQDVTKAIYYYEIAANKFNYVKAQQYLGIIYSFGNNYNKSIDKSIHYFTLAADQNDVESLFYLGYIYLLLKKNIKLAIEYLTKAAKQNHSKSQLFLGLIYYDNTFGNRNIEKSIFYLKKAAENQVVKAQVYLFNIYHKGLFVPKDIGLAVYYAEMAAKNNDKESQYFLGLFYMFYQKIPDVNKSHYYFNLSAEQNHPYALFLLGEIYRTGINVEKNLDLSLYYFKRSADIFNSKIAQYYLGFAYLEGKIVKKDINKSIHYFTLSANQGNEFSQYALANIYFTGEYIPRNINKSIYYYTISANCNNINSLFELATIYLKGKYVKRNISKAICYYKKASSFNDHYSKNNLGVIYKNGFKTPKNFMYAIELFNEAIKMKNNIVSMYNLAHLYFFNSEFKDKFIECIQLLIRSASNGFNHSSILLCLWLVHMNNSITQDEIMNVLNDFNCGSSKLARQLYEIINIYDLCNQQQYSKYYNSYKNKDYFYDVKRHFIQSDLMMNYTKKVDENDQRKDLTDDFYKGFGINILFLT